MIKGLSSSPCLTRQLTFQPFKPKNVKIAKILTDLYFFVLAFLLRVCKGEVKRSYSWTNDRDKEKGSGIQRINKERQRRKSDRLMEKARETDGKEERE